MPRVKRKQNKLANRSQVNGNFVAVPLVSEQSASQIDKDLDRLTTGRDGIVWELDNWPKSVQAVARAKGIPLA